LHKENQYIRIANKPSQPSLFFAATIFFRCLFYKTNISMTVHSNAQKLRILQELCNSGEQLLCTYRHHVDLFHGEHCGVTVFLYPWSRTHSE